MIIIICCKLRQAQPVEFASFTVLFQPGRTDEGKPLCDAPPMPPNPRQQNGSGESDATAASANSAAALNATYRVKDFIRAQVMRRLNTDCNALKCGDWVVAIHIVLRPDGRISTAEIVDNSHLSSDSAYRDFAISARDAVLLSSPLTLPPGAYDIAKDIVVDFSSRQVMR